MMEQAAYVSRTRGRRDVIVIRRPNAAVNCNSATNEVLFMRAIWEKREALNNKRSLSRNDNRIPEGVNDHGEDRGDPSQGNDGAAVLPTESRVFADKQCKVRRGTKLYQRIYYREERQKWPGRVCGERCTTWQQRAPPIGPPDTTLLDQRVPSSVSLSLALSSHVDRKKVNKTNSNNNSPFGRVRTDLRWIGVLVVVVRGVVSWLCREPSWTDLQRSAEMFQWFVIPSEGLGPGLRYVVDLSIRQFIPHKNLAIQLPHTDPALSYVQSYSRLYFRLGLCLGRIPRRLSHYLDCSPCPRSILVYRRVSLRGLNQGYYSLWILYTLFDFELRKWKLKI